MPSQRLIFGNSATMRIRFAETMARIDEANRSNRGETVTLSKQEPDVFLEEQFVGQCVAKRLNDAGVKMDDHAVFENLKRHCCDVGTVEIQEKIIPYFIDEFPFVFRLRSQLSYQEQLNDYLHKMAIRKLCDRLPPSLEPSDIVQEAMARILSKLDTYHYRAKFSTWCTTILIRTGLELIRKENKHDEREGESLDSPVSWEDNDGNRHDVTVSQLPGPEQIYLGRQLFDLIDKALERSKNEPRDKKIFFMRLEGVNGDSVAEELGITRQTVDLVMFRLKKRLQEMEWIESGKKAKRSSKLEKEALKETPSA